MAKACDTDTGWRAKRPQHLSFTSTASPESTATLPSSSTLATHIGADRRLVRSVKHFPRFDFGRFGAEALSGPSAASGMQKSKDSLYRAVVTKMLCWSLATDICFDGFRAAYKTHVLMISTVGTPHCQASQRQQVIAPPTDTMGRVRISLRDCEALCQKALQQAGLNETAAAAITANITRAEQDGCKSHGLFRLPGYCSSLRSGKVRGDVLPEVRSLAPSCALADARGGFSTPACLAGHPMLVEKAKETGVAVLLISRAHHFAAYSSS
eukprot:s5348_g3.t3